MPQPPDSQSPSEAHSRHIALMTRWAEEARPSRGRFIPDGPVDWACWQSVHPKILFLLKEAYDDGGISDHDITDEDYAGTPLGDRWTLSSLIRAWTDEGNPTSTWKMLFLWARVIQDFDPHELPDWSLPKGGKGAYDVLRSCAFVNIKKYDGNKRSSQRELEEHLARDSNLAHLMEQVEILAPDLVVCCSTFDTLQKVMKANDSRGRTPPMPQPSPIDESWGIHQRGHVVWLDYWHPAWFAPSRFLLVQGLYAMRLHLERIAPGRLLPDPVTRMSSGVFGNRP